MRQIKYVNAKKLCLEADDEGAYSCERLKIGSLSDSIGIAHLPKLKHLELNSLNTIKEAEDTLLRLAGGTELRSVILNYSKKLLCGNEIASLIWTVQEKSIMSEWLEIRCRSFKITLELLKIQQQLTFTLG